MASLLAVHGLSTPGVLIGPNGLIAVTGAATLPVGGCVMALSALPQFGSARSIPRVLAVQVALAAAIVALSLVGALVPRLVPGVPAPRSAPAIALFALGLAVYGALAIRAMNTFLLTRRAADFAVVVGIVLLACSLYGALFLIVHRPRLVARPHLRVGGHRRRRRVARLRPAPRPPLAAARRRPARRRARRLGGGVPRRTRPRAHGAPRGQGHLDGGAHAPRRDARRRGRRAARPLAAAASQPRDRRAAARHRQALAPELDPPEARRRSTTTSTR